MKKLWGTLHRDNRIIKDITVDHNGHIDEDGFFEDLLGSTEEPLRELCSIMDIEYPIWLDNNTDEFQRRKKTTFIEANFMDASDFDRLVIQIIDAPEW